jgi:hypothetical protein
VAYLAAERVSDLAPGVYRYEPLGHRFVVVATGSVLSDLATSSFGQDWIAGAAAVGRRA